MKNILKRVATASTFIKVIMALQVLLTGLGIVELFDPLMWKHGLFMIGINTTFFYVNYEWNTQAY